MVECKNWSRKVDIPVIRNLAYTSMMKGNSTVLLFTANGLTGDAQTEIERLAGEDIFILEITKEDLYSLCSADDCFELIMNKFRHLAEVRDETFNL